jgi:hypothetical protein
MTHRKDGPRALKARLTDLSDLDGRTGAAKHALRVKSAIIADLGGAGQLSELELLAAEHAALASALVADAYGRYLRGENVALSEIATVGNLFLRYGAAIGFSRRARDVTKDINAYLTEQQPNDDRDAEADA